jgi:hypothetical protein
MTDVIFTRREAAQIILGKFKEFRDQVRAEAHAATGDDRRLRREAFLEVAFNLDAWREEVLAVLGVPPLVGPPRPQLADEDLDPALVSHSSSDLAARRIKGNKAASRHQKAG